MKGKLTLGLFVVVAIAGWLLLSRDDSEPVDSDQLHDDLPDLLVEGARIYSYGIDGDRLYDLNADTLKRFSARNELVVENANLTARSSSHELWQLTANRGILTDSIKPSEANDATEKIALSGNISLLLVDSVERGFNLETEELAYYPNSRRVAGNHAVTITTDSSTVRAGTFEFDLDTDYVRLAAYGTQRVELVVSPEAGT